MKVGDARPPTRAIERLFDACASRGVLVVVLGRPFVGHAVRATEYRTVAMRDIAQSDYHAAVQRDATRPAVFGFMKRDVRPRE
jgi:hypothetical protein